MRSVSAALNRVLLAFFGLFIVCASAWFFASGLDAGHHLPGISAYLAATHDQIGAILSPHAHWLVPCGVLASVLAFVVGLFLLLMQVPRRPANSPLRLSGSDGDLAATLSPMSCRKPSPSAFRTFPGSSAAPFSSPVLRASSGFKRTRASRRTARSSGS